MSSHHDEGDGTAEKFVANLLAPPRFDRDRMEASTREDDTPVPRRSRTPAEPERTVAVDAVTHPHRSGDTTKLPEPAQPASIREPTMRLDPPTRPLPAVLVAEEPDHDPFDRVAHAAERLLSLAESLEVDRRPFTAQLLAGIAAGMRGAPSPSTIEYVGCRLATRTLLADGGVGNRLDEREVATCLVDVSAAVLGGVAAQRRAAKTIAEEFASTAKRYQAIAEKARERARQYQHHQPEHIQHMQSAAEWQARADELSAQARRIVKENR